MKTCSKCLIVKELTHFYKKEKSYRSECKTCLSLRHKTYKSSDKFKRKPTHLSTEEREQLLKSKQLWYQSNKESISLKNKEKYERDKMPFLEKNKIWRKNNKEYHFKHIKERINNGDMCLKIRLNLRSRLSIALKNNQKVGSAVSDLGCSIEEFKLHLESKFLPGMTWDNYGINGWHIDHVKPLIAYNLVDPKQLKEACYYTNLQPLWAKDNLSKGGKYGY
jgi:hypothetical protein